MEYQISFSKVFNSRNRLNGWASLIHLTKNSNTHICRKNMLSPISIELPIVKIENRACHPPFVAIRKWKTWLLRNLYTGQTCYH